MLSARCVVWTGIFALMRTPGNLGGSGVAERFLLDARVPVPIPKPPLPLELHSSPLSEFYPPLFLYELYPPPLSEFYPPPFL